MNDNVLQSFIDSYSQRHVSLLPQKWLCGAPPLPRWSQPAQQASLTRCCHRKYVSNVGWTWLCWQILSGLPRDNSVQTHNTTPNIPETNPTLNNPSQKTVNIDLLVICVRTWKKQAVVSRMSLLSWHIEASCCLWAMCTVLCRRLAVEIKGSSCALPKWNCLQ